MGTFNGGIERKNNQNKDKNKKFATFFKPVFSIKTYFKYINCPHLYTAWHTWTFITTMNMTCMNLTYMFPSLPRSKNKKWLCLIHARHLGLLLMSTVAVISINQPAPLNFTKINMTICQSEMKCWLKVHTHTCASISCYHRNYFWLVTQSHRIVNLRTVEQSKSYSCRFIKPETSKVLKGIWTMEKVKRQPELY